MIGRWERGSRIEWRIEADRWVERGESCAKERLIDFGRERERRKEDKQSVSSDRIQTKHDLSLNPSTILLHPPWRLATLPITSLESELKDAKTN